MMLRQFVYQNGQSRALETDPYHFLEKLDSGESTVGVITSLQLGLMYPLHCNWEVKHTFFSNFLSNS